MNPFRQLLKRSGHQPPVGTWLMSASPLAAEAIGHAGFDWGVIDMEHAPLDLMEVVHLLQAIAGTRMVPVLRVPHNDAPLIKRVLDAGAQALMVPFVDSADDARRAVAATRYPPQGVRGMAGMSRATRFGTAPDDSRNANGLISVIVQLETPRAVEQLETIAAVDGVDAVFLGPADLSAAMGHLGRPMHPAVMSLMSAAAQRCKAIGKPVGTIGDTAEVVAQYRAAGFDFVAIGSDLGLMMRAAKLALSDLHARGAEQVHSITGGTEPTKGY